MEQLQLAKECEAAARRGLKELAERHRQEAEKHRMLREVLEELALGARFPPPSSGQTTSPCRPGKRGIPDVPKKPLWARDITLSARKSIDTDIARSYDPSCG